VTETQQKRQQNRNEVTKTGYEDESPEEEHVRIGLCQIVSGPEPSGNLELVRAGVARAARLGELFGRRVLAVCQDGGEAKAWDERGTPLGMISAQGDWPAGASGVVVTPGDVSSRWDAARLRAVGTARP
jgi:hypothetical protein